MPHFEVNIVSSDGDACFNNSVSDDATKLQYEQIFRFSFDVDGTTAPTIIKINPIIPKP